MVLWRVAYWTYLAKSVNSSHGTCRTAMASAYWWTSAGRRTTTFPSGGDGGRIRKTPVLHHSRRIFPLLIFAPMLRCWVAHDLGHRCTDIDFTGAVLRLRWLLETVDAVAPPGCWQIAELPGSSRILVGSQYQMLDPIVPRSKSMGQRTVQTMRTGAARDAWGGTDSCTRHYRRTAKPKFAVDVAFSTSATLVGTP